MQYLVEKGADVEIANRHGHTCLMIAAYKAHIAIVRYLLDKGADVRRKSLKGNESIHRVSYLTPQCSLSVLTVVSEFIEYLIIGWN